VTQSNTTAAVDAGPESHDDIRRWLLKQTESMFRAGGVRRLSFWTAITRLAPSPD
jgi:hypothetical protein